MSLRNMTEAVVVGAVFMPPNTAVDPGESVCTIRDLAKLEPGMSPPSGRQLTQYALGLEAR